VADNPKAMSERLAAVQQHLGILEGLKTRDRHLARQIFVKQTVQYWNMQYGLDLDAQELALQTRITERSDRERPIPKVNYGASIWERQCTPQPRLALLGTPVNPESEANDIPNFQFILYNRLSDGRIWASVILRHQKHGTHLEITLSGKVAVVTGASSGIGLAITRRFLDCDAEKVIAVFRRAGIPQCSWITKSGMAISFNLFTRCC